MSAWCLGLGGARRLAVQRLLWLCNGTRGVSKRKRTRGESRRVYSLALEVQPFSASRQRRVELRMLLLQLFSCDALRDVAVLLVKVVPVDELVVARRALPSAYAALHTI